MRNREGGEGDALTGAHLCLSARPLAGEMLRALQKHFDRFPLRLGMSNANLGSC